MISWENIHPCALLSAIFRFSFIYLLRYSFLLFQDFYTSIALIWILPCTKSPPTLLSPIVQNTRLLGSALLYKVPAYSAQPYCIKYLPTLLNPIVQNTRLLGSALLYKRQTVIFILSFNIKFCLLKCALFVFIFINVHEMFLFSFEKSNLNFIFLNFNGKKLELIQIKSMKFILPVGIGYNKTFFTRFRRC